MGTMPVGSLAMLPLTRSVGSVAEVVPTARVQGSARTEDESYSRSKEDGDSQSENQESESQAQSYKLHEDGQSTEGVGGSSERSAGAMPSFDSPRGDSARISFFA
jgi:hypothetical protein